MVFINELKYININDLSKALSAMKIEKLNIFYIHNDSKLENTINYISINNGSTMNFIEINPEYFTTFLNYNEENYNFLEENKENMYILKTGDFIDIKNLFTMINGILYLNKKS